MSPSGDVPRTPDRRSSSSALFGAFRALTGGRLKSPTPPPSVSSATFTPRTPSLGSKTTVASAPTASDASSRHDSFKSGRAPVGGPPELEELVSQLGSTQPLADRKTAVDRVARLLTEYPVRNVLRLWVVGSDLLLPEQSDDAAEVGYKLLKSCVALPHLSSVERNVFFEAACLREGDGRFDLRLGIISTLTHGGRNIDACESRIVHFVLDSFDMCFRESRDAYSASRKAKGTDQAPRQVQSMALLFDYTIDVCKFNSKLFSDDDLELLLQKTMNICQETTQQADIESAIRLFDTIITYVHVPLPSIKPCLEVFCAIHRQLVGLQEITWNTLSNLFKSHIGQAAVSALLHTLLDGPNRYSRKYSMYRGAIQVLQLLVLEDGRAGLPRVPISLLIPALKASIKDEHKTQESLVIGLLSAVLADKNMRNMLLNEEDWSDLIEIIRTCAGRDEDRELARVSNVADKPATENALSATGTGSVTAGTMDMTMSASSTIGELEQDASSNGDSSTIHFIRADNNRGNNDDDISQILVALDAMSRDMESIQKATVMELFMRLPNRLSDSTAEDVIKFYVEERYFHPSNDHWLEACRSLVAGILKDRSRPRSLRILTIKTLRDTYDTIENICTSDTVLQCAALLLSNIEAETDVEVLQELVDFAVDVADRGSDASFPDMTEILKRRLGHARATSPSPATSPPPFIYPAAYPRLNESPLGSPGNVIANAFVRLFTRSVIKSARKTRILYEVLRYIAGSDTCESDARLTALKLLFRLRSDSNHSLIVSAFSDAERIAAVLCRTAETAVTVEKVDDAASDTGQTEDQLSWRDQRKVSGSSPHSSLNRQAGRHNTTGRISRPVPPLWMYPGPNGLPEEPSSKSSRVVFSHIDAEEYPLPDDILDLEVTLWLELNIALLQKATDWEVYSYVLVHLGPQLSNQALVRSCVPQLQMLRNVICEQLRNASFHEPPSYTLLKRADVAVCLYHILTMLISYHEYFEKSEEDDIVKAFLHGIGHWDRTSVWCIHALTVCCQETPLSVSKSLDSIVQKMSQIITKPFTAVHILEFLTSLARMPELIKNFREEDFKTVFGVSFRYLQYVRDQRDRAVSVPPPQSAHRSLRHSGASRDFAFSADQSSAKRTKVDVEDLPQYVYALAYHVIAFWFIGLKMEDRPKQVPWITKNLIYTDNTGRQVMEEQGQVIVDMMHTVSYSDRDETRRDPNFSKPGDGEVWKKTWIVGHSLVTIETAARTGASLVTVRRPCDTRYLAAQPLLAPPPRHQVPLTVGLASEAFYSSSYVGILPDDIFQTFYSPLNLVDPPIPLPDDQTTRRSVDIFDRNATVDGFKVGVIYISESQTNEKDILMNDIGSAPFTSFLSDLGTLVRLKGAQFNTGGLDKHDDMDGEFTYCWRDRCVELIFHIPTMMPTASDPDMTYANKKRHIGNDFVNIIFNDSGLPYDFDTFPSAFNYVAIVITPESRASFVDRRLDSDPDGKNRYFKVQEISKPGFPDWSPAAEPKILAGKHLAAYCRLLAINASVFSQVWAVRDGGEMVSSWRNRLREIKRLRERYGASDLSVVSSPAVGTSPTLNHGMVSSPPPMLSTPLSQREANSSISAGGFKRQSVTTFINEGTSRSSLASNSHSHDAAI